MALLLAGTQHLYAQTGKGTLTGKLADVTDSAAISLATITVYRISDSAIQTYRLSNGEGVFTIPGLPVHTALRLVVTHTGHRPYRQEVQFTDTTRLLDLGNIYLVKSAQTLEEVVVQAERPPVVVRNDTIEFNASAFKTLPNALVEDLLRKLPGVRIAPDGNILYNGKPVSRIKVDGRPFFGGDVRMATRNLPADVIDKVQVMDDAEELENNPQLDRSRVSKIINLQFKKGIKKGGFGKAYAGGGTDDRYEAGGIFNLFRDTMQVSVLAYTNNLNKPAFGMSDVKDIGGFNRSGVNSTMTTSSGGFALDDISFGATENGIQQSQGAGFNLNTEFGKKLTFNTRYFYGRIDSYYDNDAETIQYLGDSTLRSLRSSAHRTSRTVHQVGGQLIYRPGKYASLTVKPSLGFNNYSTAEQTNSAAFKNGNDPLNTSDRQLINQSSITTFRNEVNYNQRFRKQGRSLNLSLYNTLRSNHWTNTTEALNTFFKDPVPIQSQAQRRTYEQPYNAHTLSATFGESLSKNASISLNHKVAFISDQNGLSTVLKDTFSHKYELPDTTLSNTLRQASLSNTTELRYSITIKRLNISTGLSYQSLQNDIRSGRQTTRRHFSYWQPSLSISWREFYLQYSNSIQAATAAQLQPVVDNSNPLSVTRGNEHLTPYVYDMVGLYYYRYPGGNKFYYYANVFATRSRDAIIQERNIDDKGIHYYNWRNEDGLWNVRASLSVSKQLSLPHNRFANVSLQLDGGTQNTVLLLNKRRILAYNRNFRPQLSYSLSIGDKIDLSQTYSIDWQKGRYSDGFYPDVRTTVHNFYTSVSARFTASLIAETSYTLVTIPGNMAGDRSSMLWNAAINWLVFKNQRGTLKLTGFDLLNSNRLLNRSVTSNYTSTWVSTALTRFYLLSFTYNIRNIKVPQRAKEDKLLLF